MTFFPKSKLKQLAAEGATTAKLCEAFRRGPSSISRRLREMGVQRTVGRPTKVDNEQLNDVLGKVTDKMLSMDEGAEILGIHKRTLQRKLREYRLNGNRCL